MRRGVDFQETRFSVDALRECIKGFLEIVGGDGEYKTLDVYLKDGTWDFDHAEDFYEEYRSKFDQFHHARLEIEATFPEKDRFIPPHARLSVDTRGRNCDVMVQSASRLEINEVLSLFHQRQEQNLLKPLSAKPQQPAPRPRPTVFIGHGHSPQWRHLKDHLSDLHSYKVETYESGARAGHAIRDILEQLLKNNSFAILVMTAEDIGNEDGKRARQNVVHEAGLFQGKLGFDRAIVLEEEGIEGFSNLDGINRIRFSPGNIRETYGEVLATLRREFGDSR